MLIEAYWERVRREDKQLAHYTAAQMAAHLGKKAPKAERLKFYQDKQTNIANLDRKREESRQIKSILKSRNKRAG